MNTLRVLASIAVALLLASALLFAGTVFGSPITVRLSATQLCAADGFAFDVQTGNKFGIVIDGLACPPDKIFRNGFEQ